MTAYGQDAGRPPPLSRVVIDAVSARLRVESTDLPPLYEVVDLDALDALFRNDEAVLNGAHVTFPYHEFAVTVYADGRVELSDSMADYSTDSATAPPADGAVDDPGVSADETTVDDSGRDDRGERGNYDDDAESGSI